MAGADTINIHVEASLGQTDFIEPGQLEIIVTEAYHDYPLFLEKYYPQADDFHDNWPQKKSEEIDFIFVGQITFESLEKISPPTKGIEQHVISAHLGFFNTIYFKVSDDIDPRQARYLIFTELKPVIRHEIFHYLNNRYGITAAFEEMAAKRFGESF